MAPALVFIQLNASGQIPASTNIYFNDELTPSGTTYTASVVAAGGGLVWGAESVQITGVSFSFNTAIPTTGNIILASPVITNPLAQQTIVGFPLVMEGVALGFSASGSNVLDAGISRTAAKTIAVGNGTQGDASGTLSAAIVFAGDGSATAPSIAFANSTNTGFYKFSGLPDPVFTIGGNNNILFASAILRLKNSHAFGFSSNADPTLATLDTVLSRASAGIVQIGTSEGTPNSAGEIDARTHGITGSTSGKTSLVTDATASGIATLKAGTYSIVGDTLTQTLTGKTLTSPTVTSPIINTGISQGSGIKHQRVAGGTTPAGVGGVFGPVTVTWTSPFPDTSYTVVCSAVVTSGQAITQIVSKTASAITVALINEQAAAATASEFDCIAIHD